MAVFASGTKQSSPRQARNVPGVARAEGAVASEGDLAIAGYDALNAGEITDRRAFARAVTTGSAVTEFEAEGKAAEEIRALWAWIKNTLERK